MADENKKLTSDDERKYMRALEKDERAFKDLKKRRLNLQAAVDSMFDKKAPMKQQRLGDSVKGKDVEVIGRQGQKLAKGGRVKKRKNTRRMNRLEELGRVDAEKAFTKRGKRNLKAEKKRIVRELKSSGGSAGVALRGKGCEIR
jgi:hypothetical protein